MNILQKHFLPLLTKKTPKVFGFPKSLFSTQVDPSSIRANYFHTGICLMPHPAKKEKGGEDAACITENIVVVADGVGGWENSGVDPAKFSREFCSNCDKFIEKQVDD